MKKNLLLIASLFLLLSAVLGGNYSLSVQIEWSNLTQLPPANGNTIQPGVAGAFIGVHNDVLLIAGGANFPNGPAWEGGTKVYHKAIYILQKKGIDNYSWLTKKEFNLPEKIAYGLSIPTENGLICLGGMDGTKLSKKAFLIKWDNIAEEIIIENLPDLPVPLANMSGGKIRNEIFVAGSDETNGKKYFWSIQLADKHKRWTSLPTWSSSARTHAVGVVQNNGEQDCFYLLKGRMKRKDGISELLTDGQVYNPLKKTWTEIGQRSSKQAIDFTASAATGIPIGAHHILFFGGAEGQVLNRLERLNQIIATVDSLLLLNLQEERDSIMRNHQGFSKDVWAFHTITETWTKIGQLPKGSQVTTTALNWDGDIIIPSGEISPCIRTPDILVGTPQSGQYFGTLNYIVVIVYLLMLVALGFYFSRNQQTTDDFFKGGNRIPWWAAGLSIFGTQLSAITFMAIPAKTFATDWLYFFLMMTIIMIAPFIIRYFLPFYRRFNLTTAYQYLELRFNLLTRLIGSSMYIFLQLGRLGIVLLLPSFALSVVTGISVDTCILTMGVLSILYTVLGGIEAVIWTDVLQVFVLLGGALLSLVILFFNLDTQDIITHIGDYDKMKIFDTTFDFSSATLWVVLLGGFASNLIQYGSDQTVVQRYLTTKDEKSAAKGIWIGAWMTIPSTLIFFTLGSLLFVFYKTQPAALNFTLEKADAIFPWYIISNLPDGISGLLIAAIFAASMSSLDSSMNSVSTVVTTDFFRRLWPLSNEKAYLKLARSTTAIIGILGTGLALMMANWGISSLWDQFNMIVGLFTGGLGGIFILGIFTQKANGTGAVWGLILSGILQFLIKEYTDIHLLLYAFTGLVSSFTLGYLISLLTYNPNEPANKWTIKTIDQVELKEH